MKDSNLCFDLLYFDEFYEYQWLLKFVCVFEWDSGVGFSMEEIDKSFDEGKKVMVEMD